MTRSRLSGWLLRVMRSLYRILLVAYPKEFRGAYAEQMAQVFGDLCIKELHRGGLIGLLRLWIRTLADLVATAGVERAKMRGVSALIEHWQAAFSQKVSEAQGERPTNRRLLLTVVLVGGIPGVFSGILTNYLPFWQLLPICAAVGLAVAATWWLMALKRGKLSSLSGATLIRCEGEPSAESLRARMQEVATDFERGSGSRIVENSADSVTLRVPMNARSWGEKITLSTEGNSIRVVSRCRMPFTVTDWGKNQENVERVRQSLSRVPSG